MTKEVPFISESLQREIPTDIVELIMPLAQYGDLHVDGHWYDTALNHTVVGLCFNKDDKHKDTAHTIIKIGSEKLGETSFGFNLHFDSDLLPVVGNNAFELQMGYKIPKNSQRFTNVNMGQTLQNLSIIVRDAEYRFQPHSAQGGLKAYALEKTTPNGPVSFLDFIFTESSGGRLLTPYTWDAHEATPHGINLATQ